MANNQLLASDSFISGSLAAGWATFPGLSAKCQVISGSPNFTEPNIVGTTAGQIWTGITWPNDQISEMTLGGALSTAGSSIGLTVRMQSGVQSGYLGLINGIGSAFIYRDDAGTVTQLATITGQTFASGDVFTFEAAGVSLALYQNGKRLLYFYDATYASGYPGYDQNSASSLGTTKVSSWRGYSAVQQDGIWQKQGIVIVPTATDLGGSTPGNGLQTWNVFQDTNAQLLSGTVYKTWPVSQWNNNTTSSVGYAESTDGINWTRRGTSVLASVTNGFVFKNGSTYYLYGQASGSSGSGTMLVYTSTDGINWNQQSPSQTLSIGTGGAWDSGGFYNIICVVNKGGTWYGFYNAALNGAGPYSTGLASSPDLINWTKVGTTPVATGFLTAGQNIQQVGSNYYMWMVHNQVGLNGANNLSPYDMVRMVSTNLTSWSLSAHSMHRSDMFDSLNASSGGLQFSSILQVGNQLYAYLNPNQADGTSPNVGQIGLATATGTFSQLVANPEDGTLQQVSDSFTSGPGNLSSKWTTPTGRTALQIVSGNYVEASVLATSCYMAYTGATFSANQYSEITIQSLATSDSYTQPAVRLQTGSTQGYTVQIVGGTGSSTNSQIIGASGAGIGPVVAITPQVGDVMRLSVVDGSDGFPVLSFYQNGYLVIQIQDQSSGALHSGYPGIGMYSGTTLSNAQISKWSAGTAGISTLPTSGQAATPYIPFATNAGPGSNTAVELFGSAGIEVHVTPQFADPTNLAPNLPEYLGINPAGPATPSSINKFARPTTNEAITAGVQFRNPA